MKIKKILFISSVATTTAICPFVTSCGDKIGEEFSLTSKNIAKLWGASQSCFIKTDIDFKRRTIYTVNIDVLDFPDFPRAGQEFNFSLVNDATTEPKPDKTKFAEFVKADVNVDGKDLKFVEYTDEEHLEDLTSEQFTIVDDAEEQIHIFSIYGGKESFTKESKIKLKFTIKENVKDFDLVFWVTK